jgi:hypothetical protein
MTINGHPSKRSGRSSAVLGASEALGTVKCAV